MNKLNKQAGFTLIELVIVIVILGILAVTAAPKFVNMTADADKSAIVGLKGGIQSAMQIIYARSALDGQESEAGKESSSVKTEYGYPSADAPGILAAMEISASTGLTGDWVYVIDADDATIMTIAPSSKFGSTAPTTTALVQASLCYVTYTESTATVRATAVVTCPST